MKKKKEKTEEIHNIALEIDARPVVEMRLEILRKYRAKQLVELDKNISIAEDVGDTEKAKELRVKRQKWRDITEPYKSVLSAKDVLKIQPNDPILSLDWNVLDVAKDTE